MTQTPTTDELTYIEKTYGAQGLAIVRTLCSNPFDTFASIARQHNVTPRKVKKIADVCHQTNKQRKQHAFNLLANELNQTPNVKAVASKLGLSYARVERVYLYLKKERTLQSLAPYELYHLDTHKDAITNALQLNPYDYRTLATKYHVSPTQMYLHLRAIGFYKKGFNIPTINLILDYRYRQNETIGTVATLTKTDIHLVSRVCSQFKKYHTTPQLERLLTTL